MALFKPIPNPTREPIRCPFCGEVTLPNPLPDGSTFCSCPAARVLSPPGAPSPGY